MCISIFTVFLVGIGTTQPVTAADFSKCKATPQQLFVRKKDNDHVAAAFLNPFYLACNDAYQACTSGSGSQEQCSAAAEACSAQNLNNAGTCESKIKASLDKYCEGDPEHEACVMPHRNSTTRKISSFVMNNMTKYRRRISAWFDQNASTLDSAANGVIDVADRGGQLVNDAASVPLSPTIGGSMAVKLLGKPIADGIVSGANYAWEQTSNFFGGSAQASPVRDFDSPSHRN